MAFGRVILSTVFALFCVILTANGQKSSLIILDENNWGQILEGEWMVEL